MGVLDQLFNAFQDPGVNKVYVRKMQPEDWLPAASAMAAHQAMQDGMSPGGTRISTTLSRPAFNSAGTINIAKAMGMVSDYRQIIIDQQTKPINYRETAADVIDVGIKEGSKVIIRIISENKREASWDELARHRLLKQGPDSITFDKFSVMNISEPDQERYQIVETFAADLLYAFGRRPRMLTLAGQVLNGKMEVKVGNEVRSMDWANAFKRTYDKHFRLTQCVLNKKRIAIYANDTIRTGYLLSMSSNENSMEQATSQISITFIVDKRTFPRNNDDMIPGRVTEKGFYLTSKDTPSELFPQAKLEDYFEEDYLTWLKKRKDELDDLIYDTLEKVVKLDGASNVVATDDYMVRQLKKALPEGDKFTQLTKEFKIHQLLEAHEYMQTPKAIESYKSKVDAVATIRSAYIDDYNSGDYVENSEGRYENIQNYETENLQIKKGLLARIKELNSLCTDAIKLYQELQMLEDADA